jgi:cyclophilin family peptidyl-prolyl cis-trans isomerase
MNTLVRFAAPALALALGACATVPPEHYPRVRLETSLGSVTLELDHERAPVSVDNFLRYVRDKHYDGTQFHRVIPGFVAQAGGYDANYVERPTRKPILLESGNGLSNLRGTVAMAREEAPDSATAEFYINLVDNLKLNPHPENPARRYGYAVFGTVIDGMPVIDEIAAQPTGAVGPFTQDAPLTPIFIIRAVKLPPLASAPQANP